MMARCKQARGNTARQCAATASLAMSLASFSLQPTCSPLRSAIWIANSGVGIIVEPTPSAGHEITANMGRKTKTKAAKKKNEKAKAAKAAAGEFVSVARGRAAVLDLCPGTLASCRCCG